MRRRPEAYHADPARARGQGGRAESPQRAGRDAVPTRSTTSVLTRSRASPHGSSTTRRASLAGSSGSSRRRRHAGGLGPADEIELGRCIEGGYRRRQLVGRPGTLVARRAGVAGVGHGRPPCRSPRPRARRRPPRADPRLAVDLENAADRVDAAVLGIEWTLTMLGGGGNPSAWWRSTAPATGHDDGHVSGDTHASPRATTTSASRSRPRSREPADAWWAPVETISNSENGFERVYQGSGLLLSWPLRLGPGATRTVASGPNATTVDRRARTSSTARRRAVSAAALVVHGHFYQPSRAGSVQRARAARPDGGAGPRLERPDQRRVLPAQRRAAATSGACRGTSGRPWPAGSAGRPGRVPRVRRRRPRRQRRWPSRSTTRSCRWPRPPTGGPRSAGACATSSCAWAAGRPGCGCRRRRSTCATLRLLADAGVEHTILAPWQAATARRHAPAVPGRRSARAGSIVVALYDGRLSAAVSFDPRRRPTPTRSSASGSCRGSRPDAARRRAAARGHRHRRRAVRPPPAVPRAVPRSGSSAPTRDGRPRLRRRPAGRGAWPSRRRPRSARSATSPSARRGAAITASLRWARRVRVRGGRPLEGAAAGGAGPAGRRHRRVDRDARASAARRPDPWAARDAYVDVVIGRRGRRRRSPRRGWPRPAVRQRGRAARSRPCSRRSAGGWRCSPACGWFWERPGSAGDGGGAAGRGPCGAPHRRAGRDGPGAPPGRRPRACSPSRAAPRRPDRRAPRSSRRRPAPAATGAGRQPRCRGPVPADDGDAGRPKVAMPTRDGCRRPRPRSHGDRTERRGPRGRSAMQEDDQRRHRAGFHLVVIVD